MMKKTNTKTKIEITYDLLDEIIDIVLDKVTCEHWDNREEDGIHSGAHYDIEEGCHEAIRSVLEGKDDTSKQG